MLIRDCKYSKFAENGEVFYLYLAKAERCRKRENGRVAEGLKQKNSLKCCLFIKIFRTFAVIIIIDKKNYNEETIAFITTDFRNLGC
jgi:hypothetical protein